ncbi:MAG: pilY1-2 [Deltaproteobacteria bacterium]|nr:pilY1-2 [Deltaproteobacteria bacterium]
MRKTCFFLILLVVLGLGCAGIPHGASAADMTNNDYCVYPLYASNAVKPFILLLMDFSGSMQFPAYAPNNWDYEGNYSTKKVALCGTSTLSTTANADKKYDKDRDYYGLFDSTKYYVQGSGKYDPSTCGPDANRIGTGPLCISGNFLNWLTSTRIDVARKALTGGRVNTQQGFFESEGSAYAINDYFNNCTYKVTADSGTANRKLTITNLGTGTCVLNGAVDQGIYITDPGASTASGLVQDFYNKAYFELMVFSSDANRVGRILADKAVTPQDMINMINMMNNETPYGGTPTGEGLWKAWDLFKEEELHTTAPYYSNTAYVQKASKKDPYYDDATPISCRKGFVLLISDGAWDNTGGGTDPVIPAQTLRTTDLRPDLTGTQNVTTYAVYAFSKDAAGKNSMKATAMFGGFDYSTTDMYPYPYTAMPTVDSKNIAFPLTQCDHPTRWDNGCVEWDKSKVNYPYNYYDASDGTNLKTTLEAALLDMLRRASSGTAASVLASAEGSGANILQAFFFPKRMFDDAEIDWTGEMQNLWYYIDPQIGNSTIREDTAKNNLLDIYSDDIIEYEFDVGLGKTVVRRYSPNSSAQKGAEDFPSPVDLDQTKNLWEAGIILWQRDLASSPRSIHTSLDGSSMIPFTAAEAASNATLQTYLQVPGDPATAQNIANYVHGYDITGYRNRTVTTTYNGTESTHVWKLGDIVQSTPRLKSTFPLNSYHLYPSEGYSDRTYYQYVNDVDSSGNSVGSYKNRGMVFVGANDGMLHAFELGKLTFTSLPANAAARLETTDAALGTERWAFIPKGALPYLKYLTSTSYCHTFFVNQPVTILDASVGSGNSTATKDRSSWKTILIGGMGIGGACRENGTSCTDCVKTPLSGVGYSSYFAFDITDPVNPIFLWEFSSSDLGFSTTGPAIVRVGDADKNGKWFAVFASGPTGPIDTTYHQFMGSSDQTLKIFVLDLLTGSKSSYTTIDTGIASAFGGSLANSVIDVDRGSPGSVGAYTDDAIYLGYTKKGGTAWTKGGILRIQTKGQTNPNNWSISKLIDNTGPVTAGLTKLQDRRNGKMWIYFGTGRYYYRLNDGTLLDDPDSQQAFYGVQEPCYSPAFNTLDTTCTTTVSSSDLSAGSSSALPSSALGWYINFPSPDAGYKAHRVLTQPLASYNGIVYFLTSSPSGDVCSLGGYTYLWAVNYNNGGPPSLAALSGMVVTQLSTGQIATPILKKADGTSALTLASGRAMAVGQGISGGGFSLLGPPKPVRKILHMKER